MDAPPKTAPLSLDAFIARQERQDLLRFITCGSVDDGKSTLIGRLLWESRQLFDDQLAALRADSRRWGTQGDAIDFALLVDGLSAEREQGITIDVAWRYFSTDRRRFIVADTPGHEQYTRNMVTGASTAQLAVLLVDARAGVLTQTRRHAYLVSLVGIRQVVLAVNKMDLVGHAQAVFDRIRADFEAFARPLGLDRITAIPLSALHGDNITARSAHMAWYTGPTLVGCLETADTGSAAGLADFASPAAPQALEAATGPDTAHAADAAVADPGFVMPVQWVSRPDSGFRGFAGSVAAGRVRPGDAVRVTASGQTATVRRIVTADGDLPQAVRGQAITLTLDREVDIARGDVLSAAREPVQMSDQFEATLVWLHEDAGLAGRNYEIKLATQWSGASITAIKHRVDVNTLAHQAARQLGLNDIAQVNIATGRPLAFAPYDQVRELGAFILVDRLSHATVAAGMIRHSLRRADNVHAQALSVTRVQRERLNGHRGRVIWFTGLSGSGKSTVANALERELHARGWRTYILDGDNVRQGLNRDLGFTEADRVENIRRIAEVARLMMDAGLVVMTAFISPYRRERDMARALIGAENFTEVWVDTPLAVCEARDVKGLYRKARSGQIPNMTGINSPYEPPLQPELTVSGVAAPGQGEDDAQAQAVQAILRHIDGQA